jgi:hypothetical protein
VRHGVEEMFRAMQREIDILREELQHLRGTMRPRCPADTPRETPSSDGEDTDQHA